MDDSQTQALKNLRERYERQIRENAERIRAHIGYVLQRLDVGRSDSVGLYAEDIGASARRIAAHVAALETMTETVRILETSDEPQPSCAYAACGKPVIVPVVALNGSPEHPYCSWACLDAAIEAAEEARR